MEQNAVYCPFCDKYFKSGTRKCPLCGKEVIFPKRWDAMTKESQKEWLESYQNRPIKIKELSEKQRNEIIEFDNKFKKEKGIAIAHELAAEEARKQYTPKCPTCGCPDIERIGAGEKVVSAAMWGLFSRKIHKQFRCKNCGYEW